VGYEIYKASQSFIHQAKKNIINLAETTIEFWQEENKILSKKNQIQSFLNQVDQIAGDVERFEARLNFYIESKKS
jgi:ubiquinone biosynthesis protein UbiJ